MRKPNETKQELETIVDVARSLSTTATRSLNRVIVRFLDDEDADAATARRLVTFLERVVDLNRSLNAIITQAETLKNRL